MSYKTNWADITNATAVTSTPYTILETDYIIAVDTVSIASTSTILLPDLPPIDGRVWTIKDATGAASTYSIAVAAVSGADFIDNATSYVIDQDYGAVTVGWNAYLSSYFIISKVNPVTTSTTYVNTASYTVLITDDVLLVDSVAIGSASTILLPNSPTVDGQTWTIKDYSGGAGVPDYNYISVTTVSGSTLIDDTTVFVIDSSYAAYTVVWSLAKGKYSIISEYVVPVDETEEVLPWTNVNTSPFIVSGNEVFLSVDTSAIPITIEFPNSPATGTFFIIKDRTGDASVHNITITTVGGSVLFDGNTSYTMNTNHQSIQIIFNGTSYEIF